MEMKSIPAAESDKRNQSEKSIDFSLKLSISGADKTHPPREYSKDFVCVIINFQRRRFATQMWTAEVNEWPVLLISEKREPVALAE